MATIKGKLKTSNGDIMYPETSADKVSGLSTVATSGSYNDLSNKPTIPTNYVKTNTNTTLNDNITTSWRQYTNRYLTISGNTITLDMSQATGGWAGNFAAFKDPTGTTTSMLGFYGGASGLTHFYMGGTYSDPHFKLTPAGIATFKNSLRVPSISSSDGSKTYTLNSTKGGELALVSDIPVDKLFKATYGTTTYAQITQAVSEGKIPYCVYNGLNFYYLGIISSKHYLCSNSDSRVYRVSVDTSNTWAYNHDDFEFKWNKTNTINSSSTTSQYPSAKAVYDVLPTKTSDLTNDSGFITSSALNGYATQTWVNGLSISTFSQNASNRLVTDAEKSNWNAKISSSIGYEEVV